MSPLRPLQSETLRSLAQAARRFPPYRGSRCHPSTIMRWIIDGVRLPGGRRLRLEGLRLAGRWLTSEEAIDRFIAAQHDACAPPADAQAVPPIRTPGQRERASEAAAKKLEDLGI